MDESKDTGDGKTVEDNRNVSSAPRKSGRKWPWVVLAVIAVGAAGVYFFYPEVIHLKEAAFETAGISQATTQPSTQPSGRGAGGGRSGRGAGQIPVVSAKAVSGDLPVYLTGLGTVTPFNTVTIHTRVDGEIDDVKFIEGQEVKEGDLLVQIDPRPFDVQLQQAEGQREKDQATLDNALLDLKRYQDAGTAVTQQELDTAASTVRQLQASLVTDRAAINSAKLQLTYAKITAPVSGRIGLRLVDKGNIVHATDLNGLAVITQIKPISVIFSITQSDLPGLIEAMNSSGKSELQVEAFDRDFKRPLAAGTLLALDNQIDQTTGTVRIKASFANENGSLFPNQFVNVRLLVKTLKDVVLVPAAGVQRGPDGTFVYVIDAESKVRVRKVEVGQTTNETTEIKSGLESGERVVTDGVDSLTDGAVVLDRGPATRPTTANSPSTNPAGGHTRGAGGGTGRKRPAMGGGTAGVGGTAGGQP